MVRAMTACVFACGMLAGCIPIPIPIGGGSSEPEVQAGAVFAELKHKAISLAVSPDGRLAVAGEVEQKLNMFTGAATIFDASSRTGIDRISTVFGAVTALTFLGDTGVLAVGTSKDVVYLWDSAAKKTVHEAEMRASVTSLAYSPSEKILVVGAGFKSGSRHRFAWLVLDPATLQEKKRVLGEAESRGIVACTPDGSQIVTAEYLYGQKRASVTFWSAAGGEKLANETLMMGEILSIHMMPDGKRMLTGGYDGNLCVWGLETRKLEKAIPLKRPGAVSSVCSTADGQYAVAATVGLSVMTGGWWGYSGETAVCTVDLETSRFNSMRLAKLSWIFSMVRLTESSVLYTDENKVRVANIPVAP